MFFHLSLVSYGLAHVCFWTCQHWLGRLYSVPCSSRFFSKAGFQKRVEGGIQGLQSSMPVAQPSFSRSEQPWWEQLQVAISRNRCVVGSFACGQSYYVSISWKYEQRPYSLPWFSQGECLMTYNQHQNMPLDFQTIFSYLKLRNLKKVWQLPACMMAGKDNTRLVFPWADAQPAE